MTAKVELRPASEDDLERIAGWLAANGLPTDDLTPGLLEHFYIAERNRQPAGAIGLERLGDIGLLRSLVVAPECRRDGIGAELVTALEQRGRALGLSELWLLTIDASGFFLRHGYAVADREEAPSALRATAEFSSLCPDDAVLMRKPL